MKKAFTLFSLTLAGLLAAFPALAQQVPFLHSYNWQPGIFNPAAQGFAGGGIGIAYRQQFMDLPSVVRPTTMVFNADISPLLGSERIGVGVLLVSDKAHAINRTQATAFFAYHLLPAESSFRLSLGAMAGVLNHQFKFKDKRINDPNDLTLFGGSEGKMQFEGGFGLLAQYVTPNESAVFCHLALPQLFAQDLEFQGEVQNEAAQFDLLPHLFATAGYRHQGNGFAIEPSVTYRESGGKRQKAGTLDLNLTLRLLEGDRLSLGAGWRSEEGGLHFLLGVKPLANLQVTGVFETHSALGSSLEVGLNYAFGKASCGKNMTPEEIAISTGNAAASGAQGVASGIASANGDKLAIANTHIRAAQTTTDFSEKESRAARADQYIAQAEEALEKLKIEERNAVAALAAAEKNLAQATRKPCNADEMEQIRTACGDIRRLEGELATKIRETKEAVNAIRPEFDPKRWIANSEIKKLESYLAGDLDRLAEKPEDAKLTSVTMVDGALHFAYEYPDLVEEYNLENASLSEVKSMTDYLSELVARLREKGVQVEAVKLLTDVQYSPQGAKFGIGKTYNGEFGNRVEVHYIGEKPGTAIACEKDKSINFWELAGLKAWAMRERLARGTKMPAEKITLEITAPNSRLDYSLRGRVVLVVKK